MRQARPAADSTTAAPIPAAAAGGAGVPTVDPPTEQQNGLDDLLTLVRQRYANDNSEAGAVAVDAPADPAGAVASSDSFTGAAASARTDKLAILMSLFKSRGIAPPPLPMFEQMDGPTLPTQIELEADQADETKPEPASSPASETAPEPEPASSSALADHRSSPPSSSAEVAQLAALFTHGRSKVLKLCRLYQSGILKGAGATQACDKLTALIRTYFGFIQHSKAHPHIHEMEEDIQGDIACRTVQELADRIYALART